MAKKETNTALRTLHYYWQATKPQLGTFILAALSSLGYILFLSFGNPYAVSLIVNRVSQGTVAQSDLWATFAFPIILLITFNIAGQVLSKLQDYTISRLEIGVEYRLRTRVFATLTNQSMLFHSNRFGGSLVGQANRFDDAYDILLEAIMFAGIPVASSAFFAVCFLAPVVPVYAILLALFVVIYVIVVWRMFRRVLDVNNEAASAHNKLSGEFSDSITNILAVKTSGRVSYEREIFDRDNQEVVAIEKKRLARMMGRAASSSAIIVVIMLALTIFIVGANTWFNVAPGTLVLMFTYTYSLTNQINRLGSVFTRVNRSLGMAHDMTEILDEPTLVEDKEGAPDLQVETGAISFQDIVFSYEEKGVKEQVFDGLDLDIAPGQRIGLVGKSGAGKSTLMTLLLRLADLQSGHITIDGQDIACVTQESLRKQIAFVPQEPLLFHRSIAENIAYGKPGASQEEIEEAARKANAYEFIDKLPNKFATQVGERGVKLSGGQRQRIAIARAILVDAPILVLDEATSALDSESEHLIQDALSTLMIGRTSIVIAHRLSTVASLDRIVVLSNGHIAEDGTHQELIAQGGEYARLWSRQTGDFLGE